VRQSPTATMLVVVCLSCKRCASLRSEIQGSSTAAARIAIVSRPRARGTYRSCSCGPGCTTRPATASSSMHSGPANRSWADGPNDVNENSVVLRLTYACPGCAHPFRMLFTGDAGAQTEARMLASGVDLSADILKVGHHGSAYSSTSAFLGAVHAHVALISVGRHNLFGHPAPTTLRALHDAGARIYRTDLCGAIIVTIGNVTTIETMLQKGNEARSGACT
jgi:beta-lactamase superfamily II metal-dependent hydrolase